MGNIERYPDIEQILVIQLARFGDFLQTTPLLETLKTLNPGTRLSVLVDKGRAGLARNNPHVDEVISVDLNHLASVARGELSISEKLKRLDKAVKSLKAEHYGLVINLNYSRVAALLSNLVRADRSAGPCFGPDRERLRPSPWAPSAPALVYDPPMLDLR